MGMQRTMPRRDCISAHGGRKIERGLQNKEGIDHDAKCAAKKTAHSIADEVS